MKKLLLAACFVIGATAMSFAQGGGQGGQGGGQGGNRMGGTPEQQAKRLQTQLSLTDDQLAKVTAIYAADTKKMDSIRTAANGDRQAMTAAMQPLRKAQTDKITALLTDEQKATWKKAQEEQAARRRQGGGGGQGGQQGGTPPPPPTE
ncbi:hypothetical protein [Mucilaginibacter myungsuensis]|uniref:LTXXQ motif family protein n=1 Tax=Mucilaginibacter myungsuensis TaxID=649104 RepID=A0A929PVT8_9SPHI|nr:hypothetical protein [Mucilaginibacter myungsuensis]MBE9662133.1 hypothetical protein [Mucilaginibacter myungsuensis]MDN3599433.1 hypothetical protein [Mucilaginibacter myungsuensis]